MIDCARQQGIRRILTAGVLTALSLVGLLLVVTAPAGAATNCAGGLIESRDLIVNRAKVGELNVYFDRSTGKNCARMNHANATLGKRLKTRVWIGICAERTPGNGTCHYDTRTDAEQVGNFKYFAGPVTTAVSASGRCIAASGYLWIGGKRHTVGTRPWIGHCGS